MDILLKIINPIIAPIAYIFRHKAKKGSFLWWFMCDFNPYGDGNWANWLKIDWIRAYLWMLRNPLQNLYWSKYVPGCEKDFSGWCYLSESYGYKNFRAIICSDTEDNHGNIIDFESSPLGIQNIRFNFKTNNENISKQYRKSICIPIRIGFLIIFFKARIGYEFGLKQSCFNFPIYSYKKNKEGWKMYKSMKFKKIVI